MSRDVRARVVVYGTGHHHRIARERGVGRERWLRERGVGSARQVLGPPGTRRGAVIPVVDKLPGTVARKDIMAQVAVLGAYDHIRGTDDGWPGGDQRRFSAATARGLGRPPVVDKLPGAAARKDIMAQVAVLVAYDASGSPLKMGLAVSGGRGSAAWGPVVRFSACHSPPSHQ